MPGVKCIPCLLAALLLSACGGGRQAFAVKQFQLRELYATPTEEPMVTMEKERRLRGAVSVKERQQRLGQYYTMIWQDAAGAGSGPVEVVFLYQQGASASRVKRMTKSFPASSRKGIAEFAVIGDDFATGGRVLAWKATLTRAGREIAARQSYLWQ